jgi:hypothetical protein
MGASDYTERAMKTLVMSPKCALEFNELTCLRIEIMPGHEDGSYEVVFMNMGYIYSTSFFAIHELDALEQLKRKLVFVRWSQYSIDGMAVA